jgi:hypothetical protein
MRRIFVFSALFATGLLLSQSGSAQLVNNGATIIIQPGAFIFCQGNFENKNAGLVSNDGKLEVQGNFLNTATYNSATADDSLILSGGGNITLNGGSSIFTNLWINKTAAGDRVTLTGTALLSGKLDYDQGVFTTDPIANPSYLFSAPASAVFDFAAGKEIIGNVRRTGWAGAAAVVFNQPNMQVTTTAGTAPAEVTVTMIPLTESGDPSDNEREVKRKFQFAQTGGAGFTAGIRFPYLAGELNTNTEANLVPWGRFTNVWNGRFTPVTRDASNDWVSITGIAETDFINEWKLADPKYTFNMTAYFKGAWNNPTANMRTLLNSNGLLPLSQPYTAAPFNYAGSETVGSIPNANVVDWVLVELRNPADGLPASALAATSVGRKAAFVLNNGAIVDLDGATPLTIDINKQGAAFFVIRHRNHLGIMSNSLPSNATGTYTNDFTSLANIYTNGAAASAPATVLSASAPGNTLYGMWPGDVNVSRAVTSTDVSLINAAIAGPASGNTSVYNTRDVTLDRNVTSADVSQTNASLAATAQQSPPLKTSGGNILVQPAVKKLVSHVPGEISTDK